MIAMTTSNSTKVKPAFEFECFNVSPKHREEFNRAQRKQVFLL